MTKSYQEPQLAASLILSPCHSDFTDRAGLSLVLVHILALTDLSRINKYYYHFFGHCSAFYGLKWRIRKAKMYFSFLARWNKPMKSEIQIIVRCKYPIKIWKCLLPYSYSVGERNILEAVLLSVCLFLVLFFIFSMPSIAIIIVIQIMFLDWIDLLSDSSPEKDSLLSWA